MWNALWLCCVALRGGFCFDGAGWMEGFACFAVRMVVYVRMGWDGKGGGIGFFCWGWGVFFGFMYALFRGGGFMDVYY